MRSFPLLIIACSVAAMAHADILYVTNSGGNTVSRVDESTGGVTTFATGLNDPFGIVLAPNGNFYVANQDNLMGSGTVSQITPNGAVSAFATVGNGPDGMAVDSNGNLYVVNFGPGTVSIIPTTGNNAGNVTTYAMGLTNPTGIAFNSSGTLLYVSEAGGNIYTVTSSTNTLFVSAGENPTGMALDAQGNLYVSLLSDGVIAKYGPTGGSPTTFASGFTDPEGLVFDSNHNLVVMNLGSGDGAGDLSNKISVLSSTGKLVKSITGFTDPAYVVDLSGAATVSPSAGPNGSIIPSTAKTVAVGTAVNFTATPASGYEVDQWVLNNVVAQIGGSSFAVTNATPGDTVAVTFTNASMITAFPGVYIGLLDDNNGYVSITLAANGQFTGKAVVGAVTHTLAGKFSTLGAYQGVAAAGGGKVSFQLVAGTSGTPGSYSITGGVDGVDVTAYHAAQDIFSVNLTAASSTSGIPQSASAATLTLAPAGAATLGGSATLAGTLPDGEPFTASTTVVGGSSGNQCIFYAILAYPHASPASAKGILSGSITFPSGVVTGPLLWTKPAQTEGSYPAAFTTALTVSP